MKTIPEFINYMIDTDGNIISLMNPNPRIMKQSKHHTGYMQVCIRDDNGKPRVKLVHRLVMVAYNGESGLTVNHKDGNKTNNSLSNLEYCTIQDNIKHRDDYGLSRYGRSQKGSKSKYAGVTWHKGNKNWTVNIRVDGKSTYYSSFDNEDEAGEVAQKVYKLNKKEFA